MTGLTERHEVQAARDDMRVAKARLAVVSDLVGQSQAKYEATHEILRASQAVIDAAGHSLDALDRALQLNEQEEERG
ncbi:hypothetical protein [Pseudoclavibacter helvolus]|uniref:hypothetical protein n=1 Tax=Pseudoclavibacter helvolus TaxID=255205 RepID=UPI003C708116